MSPAPGARDGRAPGAARDMAAGASPREGSTAPGGGLAEGATATLTRQAWQLPGSTLQTAQIAADLRGQLVRAGYEIVFACEDEACGGFDFRYALPLLPEPQMHVDLGDYRYIAARHEAPGGGALVALMVSRSEQTGYIQLTHLASGAAGQVVTSSKSGGLPGPLDGPAAETSASVSPSFGGDQAAGVTARLAQAGRAPLDDLTFAPGSSRLGDGPFASLRQLADYLEAHPGAQALLVGHSDSTGALPRNIALSEQRARSVMARLSDGLGVPARQLRAEGAGFLAPRASNATAQGRASNRRVEVVLLRAGDAP
ncbi:OmpA family protein [Profundibacterium mesophilum]|nr:OmpA family protein [Profundibacterium mesophilum]